MGHCGNVELSPHEAKSFFDMAFLMWVLEKSLPTHQSLHILLYTKESAGKPGPPWVDLDTQGLPTLWARPCLLASYRPGPCQHSHCEKRWLALGWGALVLPLG